MEYIQSKDGTQIAYEKIGKSTELIIIGGSLADHQKYAPLANELSQKLTVFNYDRRNRGKSCSSSNHTIETELQDLEAIISLCKTHPILYGHSAGAGLAIRAIASGLKVSKLILSDLPFTPMTTENDKEVKKFEAESKSIQKLLTLGNKVSAVKFFLKDFGMNEQELNAFVESENGKQAVANSITLPVDYDILGNGLTPNEMLKRVEVPSLILTSHHGMDIAKDVDQYLSNCTMAVLESPTYSLSASDIAKPIFNFLEETQ